MVAARFVKCKDFRMGSFVGLTIVLLLAECRGDYMMGGHLDNKEDQGTMEHRSGGDELIASESELRRPSLEEVDHEFDLELDLFGEQSGADPTRISIVNSSSGSSSAGEEATTNEDPSTGPRYRVLPYAFNGGHPFSLEKDPITGQIDFEKAPPLKALEYHVKTPPRTEEPEAEREGESSSVDSSSHRQEDEESGALGPNEINPYSPSFHDFLNLPVRYTYDKYKNSEKYPLISNSYANTKVQSGSNSYNTYNHKKYHEAVKSGVDVQTLYVQPSRKTYAQSITKTSTTQTISTKAATTTTTARPNTTNKMTTTSSTTTSTTPAPPSTATTKRSRYPAVTTWKPQRKPSGPSVYGTYDDYEGTLPIERLQQNNPEKEQTTTTATTEKSRYQTPPPRPKTEQKKPEPEMEKNDEYEEGYDEDYDRILQISDQPNQPGDNDRLNDSQDDYSYGIMDFVGGLRPSTEPPTSTSPPSSTTTQQSSGYPSETTTSTTSIPVTTSDVSTTLVPRDDENRTTTKASEEKRVTSMPLDTIGYNENYRVPNYGNGGGIIGTIDNSIPNNNLHYQQNRPSSNDKYYPRPPLGMPSGGIVVKSTSNVVVPPGQDTVSFVLGNRQSVGSVSDAGADFYGVHSPGPTNERPSVTFGKIGSSRPVDNFGGSMIVSAGIGVGSNPIGPYHQRPSTSGSSFDHTVVTVGMPTVDIVNPGESGSNKKPDSTSNALDTLAQQWWASTSSSANNNQQSVSEASQDPTNQQFGYRVVFPDESSQSSGLTGNENSSGTQRPVEEHVIVVHESEIGNGNTLHLDLSSQSTPSPTTNYHHETTTQQHLPVNPDEKLLPELSESLTPPAERPNILPSGIQRPPSYNYYHHSSYPPGNSRPNDYRGPGRLPTPPSNNYKRRPTASIESNLPNILPQFRPNAKTSHGHNRGETIGTIPAGSVPPYVNSRIRRPPGHVHHHHPPPHRHATSRRPSGPPHLQRLNPPPLPPPPPPISSLRLPTPASLIASPNLGHSQHDSVNKNSDSIRLGGPNRLHKVSLGAPPSLSIDERHHQPSGFVNTQPVKSRLEDDTLERFSAEPPVRLPYFTKRTTSGESDGIPRIATLQMIQQHSGPRDDDEVRPNLPPPYRFNDEPSLGLLSNEKGEGNVENSSGVKTDRRGDVNEEKSQVSQQGNEATRADYVDTVDSPVYVVYPVKGALDIRPTSNDDGDQDDGSVVLGTYGSQRPLPPDTLLKDSEDNDPGESPFGAPTIVNVSPSFTETSGPQLASDFPYPLERPDPSMFTSQLREKPSLVPTEQQNNGERLEIGVNEEKISEEKSSETEGVRDIERDASVNVIPYLQDHVPFTLKENAGVISATLHRLGSSASIVAASSTPIAYVYTPTTRAPVRRHEDPYVQGSFERGPVLLPSQQPSSSSSSAPSPQSFMAPFVASASAEAPSKNGWSVVMPGQSAGEDSSMDRRRHDPPSQKNDKSTSSEEEKPAEVNTESKIKDEDNKRVKDDYKAVEPSQTEETDSQTEKSEFDVENFTPQLFGGFKPIFEFPSDSDTEPNIGDKVTDDSGSMIERPRSETG
ncbi:mucin-12-like [Venturia canescens]|uniref:mucin-12-like n=1 Tax=Venturia canescens TaxID=32260 RepID=UPI001C9BDECD|nr:mucin-12-like [Venturia canescens]